MDIVDQTLKHWRSTAFVWGQSDCMLSVGDYIAACGGQDVTGLFRGEYDTEEEALTFIGNYGGAAGLVDLTGLPHTIEPRRGDVIVIDAGQAGIGALCTGDGVAARLERGVIELPLRMLVNIQAWRVE